MYKGGIEMEQALTMRNIRDLVTSWRAKAYQHEDKRFKDEYTAEVANYLSRHKDLHDKILALQAAFDAVPKCGQALAEEIHGDIGYDFDPYYYLQNCYVRNAEALVFNVVNVGCREAFPFLRALAKTHELNREKIKNEYKRLNELITGCVKAKRAKKMLTDMGLDVSCLVGEKNLPVAVSKIPFDFSLMGLQIAKKEAEQQ
jgi:hypothetical protein